jgi:hypothetical protein
MTPVILSRKGGGGTGGTGTAQALSIGVSTGGNTAGNTAVSTGSRFVIVGSGDITASQATAAGATTVTLSGGAAQALSIGVSTGGNTSGDTTVNTGSRLVLAGGNNITLSQATAAGATTISISGPNTAGAAGGTVSMWPDQNLRTASINGTILSFTTGATRTTLSAQIFPMVVPANLSLNQIRGIASMSMTSNTTNSHWTYTQGMSMGIYSLNADTI